jgi:hypothetical protein
MRKLIKGNKTLEILENDILVARIHLSGEKPEEDAAILAAEEARADEVITVDSDVVQHPEQPEIDYTKSILLPDEN